MVGRSVFVAGYEGVNLPLRFRFHYGLAGIRPQNSTVVARFTEFWCQDNCRGRWRVEERDDWTIEVGFDADRDAVLFYLSEEYATFAAKPEGVLERPSAGM